MLCNETSRTAYVAVGRFDTVPEPDETGRFDTVPEPDETGGFRVRADPARHPFCLCR